MLQPQRLTVVPDVQWLDDAPVRKLLYQGPSYRGRPSEVYAVYADPSTIAEGSSDPAPPWPGMVLIHGGGGTAFPQWATMWAKRGYAAIAMDLGGRGPEGQRLERGGPSDDHEHKFTTIHQNEDEHWPPHAVGQVILAHNLLRAMPQVDPDRIGVTGISWGGYLTCIVAGNDPRFACAVPVYGCGFLTQNSVWLDQFAAMSPTDRVKWATRYDPANHLLRAAMPMFFVNGTNDFAYPIDSHTRSIRCVSAPVTVQVLPENGHNHEEGWRPPEIMRFVDSMFGRGPALAQLDEPRVGRTLEVGYRCQVPLAEARLCYTFDQGPSCERHWHAAPLSIGPDAIRGDKPAEGVTAWLVAATDVQGHTVTTIPRVIGLVPPQPPQA